MPRPLRTTPGGLVYHVLNRANAKRTMFHGPGDYRAFERVLGEVQQRVAMRILAWCVMPNHWHLLLWPREDGDLSEYMRLVTVTHAQRLHAHRVTTGTGHVYQGRFKAFIVQTGGHFLAVARYVEANALRAKLVRRAEEWPWGSAARSLQEGLDHYPHLTSWPIDRPREWLTYVNEPVPDEEAHDLQRCAWRGSPYGDKAWVATVANELGLASTLRPRGRPTKENREKVPDPFIA